MTSSLRRRDRLWVTRFGFGLCIKDFFFFFLINTSVLCVWFAAFSVFGLLLYWGLISLPTTTRRDGILPGASDVMGSISDSLYFFFLG